MNYITINTDASYYHSYRVGAYAFWLRAPHYTVKLSGVLRGRPGSAFECEAKSMANALYALKQREKDNTNFKLVINSDALFLIEAITGKRGLGKTPARVDIVRHLQEQLAPYDYELRHVKAHTGDLSTARSFINDWCDNASRSASRQYIASLEREKATPM